MMRPEDFYAWHEQPRQGDIVLCGLSRIIAQDRHSPPQWEPIDAHFVQIDNAWDGERSLGIAAGIGLAMVLTHDCQLDKQWNQRVRELQKGGMATERAEAKLQLTPRSTERSPSAPSLIRASFGADVGTCSQVGS